MKKNRDLLDYASVGAEIAQVAQLSSISSSLNNLLRLSAAEAADRAEARDQEVRQQEAEDGIREFVFQGSQLIAGLRKTHLQSNPRGALVLTRTLAEQMRRCDLKTSRVRSHADKEAVQGLLDGVTQLRRDCENVLSREDLDAVTKCLEYRAEVVQLEAVAQQHRQTAEAIAQQRNEWSTQLQQKETALASLPARTKPCAHPALVGLAFVLGLLIAVGVLQAKLGSTGTVVGISVALFIVAIGCVGLIRVPNPEAERLKSQIETLTARLAEETRSPEPESQLRVFGPGMPESGCFYASIRQFIQDRMPTSLTEARKLSECVDAAMRNGYKLVIRHNGVLFLYSHVNPRISAVGLQALEQTLGMQERTPVIWMNCEKQRSTAGELFAGLSSAPGKVDYSRLRARSLTDEDLDLDAIAPSDRKRFGNLSLSECVAMIQERQSFIDLVMYAHEDEAVKR